MKDIFVAFAKYNQRTNSVILQKLREMNEDQIRNHIQAYYSTIADTIFHVMSSDRKWLQRLSKYYESSSIKGDLGKFKDNEKMNLNKVVSNISELSNIREMMDLDIVRMIEQIPDEDLLKEVEIPWGNGTIKRELWKLLLQWFNHQTHHRGQISVQLDIVGIENDYSMVLDKIE